MKTIEKKKFSQKPICGPIEGNLLERYGPATYHIQFENQVISFYFLSREDFDIEWSYDINAANAIYCGRGAEVRFGGSYEVEETVKAEIYDWITLQRESILKLIQIARLVMLRGETSATISFNGMNYFPMI